MDLRQRTTTAATGPRVPRRIWIDGEPFTVVGVGRDGVHRAGQPGVRLYRQAGKHGEGIFITRKDAVRKPALVLAVKPGGDR